MEDYKSNSHKFREEQTGLVEKKKVEKVVTGSAKAKKKSEIQKFTGAVISEDISRVVHYLTNDVLIPSVKDAIASMVKNGIDMLIYGEPRDTKKRTTASKVSYRSYYDEKTEPTRARSLGGFDYDNVIFETRGDAEVVLSAMDDIIEQYGVVSVNDLYELADVTTTNYMVSRYGWYDIRSALPVRVSEGWMIKFPKPIAIR